MGELEQIKKDLVEMKELLAEVIAAKKQCEAVSSKLSKKQYALWDHEDNLKNKIKNLSYRIVELVTS